MCKSYSKGFVKRFRVRKGPAAKLNWEPLQCANLDGCLPRCVTYAVTACRRVPNTAGVGSLCPSNKAPTTSKIVSPQNQPGKEQCSITFGTF
jgi:hypothetical protein